MSKAQAVLEKHGVEGYASVGDGWADLLDRLITKLLALGWDREVHQIKEKFGGLRFYIGVGSDEVFDALDEAEAESFRICERCGKPGAPRTGGWIQTLCEEHAGGRGEA